MILYHASTAYQVLCCLVHKLAYNRKDEAVLMIVEHMLPKAKLEQFMNKIKEYDWFVEIISVPESSIRLCHGRPLNIDSSENEILEVIHNICNEVDGWYKSGFLRFRDIYLASDQWSVGVYLLYHKIPYHYLEDASGMLGDEERYLNIIRQINLTNYVLGNYLKGAGRSDNVISKLCDLRNQPNGFKDDKAVDFSIYHIVSELPKELINDLLKLYGAKRYRLEDSEQIVVYMTQFLRTLTIKNLKVQESITTLLIDYFAKDSRVIIKPHPKDRWIDYPGLIPEAYVLERDLPSELLPFVFEGKIDLVLTASSTSIGGMAYVAKNSISFGTDVEYHYERLHLMYAVAKIINEIYREQVIITHNIKSIQLEHFLSMYSRTFKINSPSEAVFELDKSGNIYVDGGHYSVGDACKKQYLINEKNDVLIFLNYRQRYEFFMNTELQTNNFIVISVDIKHSSISTKDICYGLEEETGVGLKSVLKNDIWVYCEKEEERRRILDMQERKTLKYSGLEVEISSKEATYFMILNGKMKAMQYALQQKENEEQNIVLNKMKEVIKQYQEEEMIKRILLEEEGIIYE
ncbi:hypothetical protein [Anaeromicropila herbilytica]|uniref:Uncharacterized protein n=1 Tax=Anaeromicropila herbilytica TaxID=2785025 RepID=A0A7R7EI25_9FIRM|nr:hypothetical protein [Anaeromicropila herbilytica]BCN29605.1 hypothetical protein bsdtb5_09000 [Anaeromicropila herbilytica]